MRRLTIIDLSTGQQPISNEDETIWIVFNGEIYNYRQLREDLEAGGHRFRTTSDTEVIVHLYEDLGEACVQRLRGMFAFAIWDRRRQILLLARDRLGIKPLYYAQLPQALIFASELKSLLAHPAVPCELEPYALAEYFTHLCVPGHLSIFKAIRKLPPAHTLTFTHGDQVRLSRYWHIQPDPDYRQTRADWIPQVRAHLQDAVESHLVADVPVGAFLSGGLDSGAMVALMASTSAHPVRTFTVGFSAEVGRFDERIRARAIATRYSTIHQECLVNADVANLFPRIVRAFDEPFADSSAIPNWLICQETARHVKVALSGLGGDELFGGYERYVGLVIGEGYRRMPRIVRRVISPLLRHFPGGNGSSCLPDRLKRFASAAEFPAAERYRAFIAAFWDVKNILHPDLHAALLHQTSRYDQVMGQLVRRHTLDVGLFADLYIYLPDDLLTLTDRISMAHSLEVRVPFLDHQLIELLARMPAPFKVHGVQKKALFRRAIAPWVPSAHLSQRKQGFSVPMNVWLKGPLKFMLLDLLGQQKQSPWLNHATAQQLVAEHLGGIRNHEVRLWAILCFLEWERQFASFRRNRGVSSQRHRAP
jgi:asparagine synthase (glutamine-hydrolysing)